MTSSFDRGSPPVIIGAGIAGLTLSIALRRKRIEAEIFESALALHPIGAGIWIAPNAMRVMDRLGLSPEIIGAGVEIERISIADYRLRELASVHQGRIKRKFGFHIVSIQRAELHRILISACGCKGLHLGKRLTTIAQASAPEAVFDDGSHVSAPFIVGADGVHSAARRALFGEIPFRRSGQTCWRGLADFDLPPRFRKATVEMWGHSSRMGVADVGQGKAYWFLVKSGWRGEEPRGIVKDYAGIAPALIEATPADTVNQTDLDDLPPRLPWSQGRVCLIGDAAHPMTPNMGQGGAQAIEDACVLAQCLSGAGDVAAAFTNFQEMRFPKVKSIVNSSFRLGALIHSSWPRVRDTLSLLTPNWVSARAMDRVYQLKDEF